MFFVSLVQCFALIISIWIKSAKTIFLFFYKLFCNINIFLFFFFLRFYFPSEFNFPENSQQMLIIRLRQLFFSSII